MFYFLICFSSPTGGIRGSGLQWLPSTSLPYLMLTHSLQLGFCLAWAQPHLTSPGSCVCPTCTGWAAGQPPQPPSSGENSPPGRHTGRHSGTRPVPAPGTARGCCGSGGHYQSPPAVCAVGAHRQTLLSQSQADSCHKQSISFVVVK